MSQENVLEYLRHRQTWVRPAEIQEELELASPNVYRALNSLLKGKFIERRMTGEGLDRMHPFITEVRILEDEHGESQQS